MTAAEKFWERRHREQHHLVRSMEAELARYRQALELIAMPVRSDGTYNRSREACEQLAKKALES